MEVPVFVLEQFLCRSSDCSSEAVKGVEGREVDWKVSFRASQSESSNTLTGTLKQESSALWNFAF